MSNKTPCAATYDAHVNTTIQRIGIYKTRSCRYNGRVTLVHKSGTKASFCKTHVRMALEGFVDEYTQVTGPLDRAEHRKYDIPAPNLGEWTEPDAGSDQTA